MRGKTAVHVHPSSSLHRREPSPKLVVYHELVQTTREFMREVLVVDADWIREIAPHVYPNGLQETKERGGASRGRG